MGIVEECEFCDIGTAPEYFVECVGRHEFLPGGNVRYYLCAKRGNLLIVQYTSIIPIVCLATMGRRNLEIASEYHTEMQMSGGVRIGRGH